MQNFLIVNGPNLNLLGTREPEVYGHLTFDEFLKELREKFSGIKIDYFQSNVEGELINKLQQAAGKSDGIILNAGGYTHTSVALADCLAAIKVPVVEVHISNIHAREDFRQKSLTAIHTKGVITGFGLIGYELALKFFTEHFQD